MEAFRGAVPFMIDNFGYLTQKAIEHLLLSGASILIAIGIALPIGLWLGHLHRGSFVAINVCNIGRALPSLALIALGIAFLGIGFTNVMVALVVLAVPPILTNTYVAIDGVDPDAVEAARAMGFRPFGVLWRVELPLALPLIFAGMRTSALYVISTAAIAAIAGGGGLGEVFVDSSQPRAGVVAAAMWVAALALLIDGGFGVIQRAVTPTGMDARSHAVDL